MELKSVFNKWDEVAIVAIELHGYNKNYFWELLKKIINFSHKKIFLCTDFPKEAKSYFE